MPQLPDISSFRRRHEELDQAMAQPDFYSDQRRAAELSREHQKLSQLLEIATEFHQTEEAIREYEALIADSEGEAELKELAEEELPSLRAKLQALYQQALAGMIPADPSDSRNTIVEVRAGTGGDEASLFAGDLYRMYTRYAERQGWRIEPLSSNESEAGGFKEVTFLVSGEEVYRRLKFESGVHRVQRVPVTEASGRIHTSAATVAVLPEAEEVDVHLDPNELEISVARASGPGGQGVNTTDSAVQILHKPTGLIVKCADERSQLKNKQKAMKVLRARLLEQRQQEEQAKYAAHRKSQVGSGDRSERIRTYNFPQGRITDHRINFTAYNLEEVVGGRIDEIVEALQAADQEGRIQALLESGPVAS